MLIVAPPVFSPLFRAMSLLLIIDGGCSCSEDGGINLLNEDGEEMSCDYNKEEEKELINSGVSGSFNFLRNGESLGCLAPLSFRPGACGIWIRILSVDGFSGV